MSADYDDLIWGGLLALIIAVVYLSFLSNTYVIEGLARAIPIELGRIPSLYLGTYLLYGPIGYAFTHMAWACGYSGLAVGSLQAMDALLGAGGIFIYFLTLRRLGADRLSAAVWCAILGFSLGYWRWSTEAEDYIFSTLMLQANLCYLVYYASKAKGSPVLLGILHAAAVMGHIVNAVFAPVTLWVLVSVHGRSCRGPILRYLGAAAGVLAAVYGLTLACIIRPSDGRHLRGWLLGSAGTGPGGKFNWHGGTYSAAGFWHWIKMSANIFTSFQPSFPDSDGRGLAWSALWIARVLLVLLALVSARSARKIIDRKRTVAVGCCLWLACYALVFTSWEPYTMVYRVSDLVPLCTLLFLGYQETQMGSAAVFWRAGAVVLAISLVLGNFHAEIHPRSLASNNPALGEMAFLRAHSAEGDWIAANGGIDAMYLPWFAQRRPLVVDGYLHRPAELAAMIDRMLADGQAVFLTSRLFKDPLWVGFFQIFRPQLEAEDGRGFGIYRLRPKA